MVVMDVVADGTQKEIAIHGEVLRRLREAKGWSQGELAYHAKIDQSQISKIESGALTDVRLSSAKRLATALGASVDALAGLPYGYAEGPIHRHVISESVDLLLHEIGELSSEEIASIRAYVRLLKEEKRRHGRGSAKGS